MMQKWHGVFLEIVKIYQLKMVGLILKQVIFIFITKMKTHKIY